MKVLNPSDISYTAIRLNYMLRHLTAVYSASVGWFSRKLYFQPWKCHLETKKVVSGTLTFVRPLKSILQEADLNSSLFWVDLKRQSIKKKKKKPFCCPVAFLMYSNPKSQIVVKPTVTWRKFLPVGVATNKRPRPPNVMFVTRCFVYADSNLSRPWLFSLPLCFLLISGHYITNIAYQYYSNDIWVSNTKKHCWCKIK